MTTELVPIQETVSLPITVTEAIHQWNQYQELTRLLLGDTDYQQIGSKQFKKKSAWRKYARAFNISDEVSAEEIKRSDDGYPLWARLRVKATAPNGRFAEADHECHISERCCQAAQGLPCEKSGWKGHTCCTTGCNGRIHWSHPGDLPATALTRAKNRAISDLIGAGEVSAEEMQGQRHLDDKDSQHEQQRPVQAPPRPRPPTPIRDEPPPEAYGEPDDVLQAEWDEMQNESPATQMPVPRCQFCQDGCYDNRPKKASGEWKETSPDFACKNKTCNGKAWIQPDGALKWSSSQR